VRLYRARWVLPIATPPIPDGAVLLDDDDTIVAVGRGDELRRAHPAAVDLHADGILLPGLVNAHAHLELSALAARVPGGGGVAAWTRHVAIQLATVDKTTIDTAAAQAARDAVASGTAAIGDVGNGTAGYRARMPVALGGIFFHELVGSRETRTGDAVRDAAAERDAIVDDDRPHNVVAIPAPHAPYSVGPALMRRIFAAAAGGMSPTSIHLAEDLDEILLLRDGTGAWPAILKGMGVDVADRVPHLGPVAYIDRLGAFAGPTPPLLVHMVHADADDRRRARAANATVVLCPRSNLHIGGRLPDVPALIEDRIRLAIGTDSLASVPDLSLWADIATLAQSFPTVPPSTWLNAATTGGATALGLTRHGALAPGMRPGVLDVVPAAANHNDDPVRALTTDPHPRITWIAHA
jgi:cytosine/adenosine deaminase-related metal-dependent hydrolase